MSHFLGEEGSSVDSFQRLVRIAKYPQGQSRNDMGKHPGVLSVQKGMGAVPLEIIERNALIEMGAGSGWLTAEEQTRSKRKMGLQEQRGILRALGQSGELLSQVVRRLQFRPQQIKYPQSAQGREQLRAPSFLLTQLARPGVRFIHL